MRLWILVSVFGLLVTPTDGQWEPDRRLTNDPASSLLSRNSAWCVATGPGGLVHACWWDDRSGNNEVYYKRSTDRGVTWSADAALTDDTARSWTPSITVCDSTVHLAWFDTRDGASGEVYYQRSTDAGVTWLPASRMSFDTAKSEVPAVAASGTGVHLVWRDSRDARFYWEIYYRRSTDAGQTWSGEARLTTATSIKWNPSVAACDSLVHVVWADNRDGDWEVYYKRSTDDGSTWQPDVPLTRSVFAQQWPCVVAVGSTVVAAWSDGEDVDGELFCRCSEDGGATWLPQSRITGGSAQPGMWTPSLALSGNQVHAVWPDGRDGNFEVYYCRSTDRGMTWESEQRLTQEPAVSNYPCVGTGDSVVHVLWSDYRDGVFPEVYYKRDPAGNVAAGERSTPHVLRTAPEATVVRASALRRGTVLYDITGKRVRGCAGPGVYFAHCGGQISRVTLVK